MSEEDEHLSFPTNPEDFGADDRISFSKLDGKFVAVQSDGAEFEFDHHEKKWIAIDEETLRVEDDLDTALYKKRKAESSFPEDTTVPRPKQAKKSKAKQPRQPKQNTAIYVTGLPPDATVEEIQELFQRKCGVIAEEIDNNRPRIKMYTDDEGKFKGDALIVFFKPESVNMAITLLDDTEFRYSPSGLATGNIRVQAADSSYKKTTYNTEQDKAGGNGSGSNTPGSGIGGGNGNYHSADARSRAQDKAKVIKKTQKLEAKLADWDDDEPSTIHPGLAPLPPSGKNARIVILKHMFTLDELDEDPKALLEIKEDIRDECSKLGAVTSVVLFDEEEDGIVRVKFKDADAAEKCILTMHGRLFDGRTVEAYLASGKVKFRKSSNHGNGNESDDSD